MKRNDFLPPYKKKRKYFNPIGLLILTIVCLFFLALWGFRNPVSHYWPGWFLLQIAPDFSEEEILKELHDAHVTDALAYSNVHVPYMAIPQIERVLLQQIPSILILGDPRLDPFLLGVKKIFRSQNSSVIYLPNHRSLATYRRLIHRIPSLKGAILLDDTQYERLLTILFFLLGGALLTWGNSLACWARRFALLPWALYLSIAGPTALIPVFLLYFMPPSAIFQSSVHGFNFFAFLGSALSLTTLFLYAGGHIFPLFFALLAAEALWFFFTIFFLNYQKNLKEFPQKKSNYRNFFFFLPLLRKRQLVRKNKNHHLFEPLLLSASYQNHISVVQKFFKDIKRAPFHPLLFFTSLGLLFTLSNTVLIFLSKKSHPPVPLIGSLIGNFTSPRSYSLLAQSSSSPDSLVDVSDMLSSRVYQEGFLYGSTYKVPLINEGIFFPRFRREGTTLAQNSQEIIRFNEAWYARFFSEDLSEGMGRLFATIGGPAPLRLVQHRPMPKTLGPKPLQQILLFLTIFIAITGQVLILTEKARITKKKKQNLSSRRRGGKAA